MKHLLSFGVVGVQSQLLENRWLPMMRGVSAEVKGFDRSCEAEFAPHKIYVGGGQGLLEVATEAEAGAAKRRIEDTARECGLEGVVVLAEPLADSFGAAFRRLRVRGECAKDELKQPGHRLPEEIGAKLCGNCRRRDGSTRLDFGVERGEVCTVCKRRYVAYHGSGDARGQQLELGSLSSTNMLAMVVADGNGIGRILDGMESRAELQRFSEGLSAAMDAAQAAAVEAGGGEPRVLTSISGGDDLQAFVDPHGLLDFVDALISTFEGRAPGAAGGRGPGLGLGVLVASDHYPARQFAHHAHELMDRAKELSHRGGGRSAIGLGFMVNGDEALRGGQFGQVFDAGEEWAREKDALRALCRVSGAQRQTILAALRELPEAEADNLFRYQVARHPAWRDYVGACDRDWRVGSRVVASLVSRERHDAARFLFGRTRQGGGDQ